MSKRKRVFFFHYNKPRSARSGHPVLSLHYQGACHYVSNVVCEVRTQGRVRKQQPRFVMVGKAASIEIINEVAYIR